MEKENERNAVITISVTNGHGEEVDKALFSLKTSIPTLRESLNDDKPSLSEWIENTVVSNAEYEKIV